MASVFRAFRRAVRPPSAPRQFPIVGFPILDSGQILEEERDISYSSTSFYPARIGEVLNARYQIVGKLGYGGYSTVWLCRDLINHDYVALKLCRSDAPNINREIEMYRRLNTVSSRSAGSKLVRKLLANFEVRHTDYVYPCLVHKPLGISLAKFRRDLPDRKLPESFLKQILIHILISLSFLHNTANIMHCDLQEKNIFFDIQDTSILGEFEQRELKSPSPRKIDGNRIIYVSRELDEGDDPGRPVLADFGEGRFKTGTHTGLIQPSQYRAPEVLLEMPWNHKVDIWNVGVLIWDLFEDENMFNIRDSKNKVSVETHLAHIVALLGPPPAELVTGNTFASKYFNVDGSWRGDSKIPKVTLETSESNLEGENKALFLSFVRKMLQWKPEGRSEARELLTDPWLRDGQQFA